MSTTFAQIIAIVANRYGRYVSGAAASGSSTTTLIDSALYYPDNSLINHFVYLTGGTTENIGKERIVTAYSQSAGRLTISPALGTSIAVGDTYEVKACPHQDIIDAIQAAIRSAGTAWTAEVDAAAGVTFTGAGDYSLPAACVEVLQVWSQGGDGEYKPVQAFEVVGPLGTKRLILHDYALALESGSGRVRYRSLPTMLAESTDTLGLDDAAERFMLDYIAEFSLFYLHNMELNRAKTGDDSKMRLQACQMHYQLAAAIKAGAVQAPTRMVGA